MISIIKYIQEFIKLIFKKVLSLFSSKKFVLYQSVNINNRNIIMAYTANYIQIPKRGNVTAQTRSFTFNHALYLLSTPGFPDPNGTVFPIVEHPDGRTTSVMMRVELDFTIPVNVDDSAVWDALEEFLNDMMNAGQATNLLNWIKSKANSSFLLEDIIPSGIPILLNADLIADGWLKPPDTD